MAKQNKPVVRDLTFIPIDNRVLIEVIDESDVTPVGIYIPETAKQKSVKGIAIAVGAGLYDNNGIRIPCTVKEGDEVVFNKYAGAEIKLNGRTYLVIKETDILGIVV